MFSFWSGSNKIDIIGIMSPNPNNSNKIPINSKNEIFTYSKKKETNKAKKRYFQCNPFLL